MAISVVQPKNSWNEWYLLVIATIGGFAVLLFLFFVKPELIIGQASPSIETIDAEQNASRLNVVNPNDILQGPQYQALTKLGNLPLNLPVLGKQNPFSQ